MTEKKITFTTKSINKENNGVDINVRILPLDFAADGSNINIVRIYFIMHDEKQKQKLDILEEQKTYELSFDDKGIEINKSEGGSNKNNKNFCCAAGPDDELRPNKPEEKHYVMVNEANKEIRVLVFPEFQLNIVKQETTDGNDSEEQTEDTTGNEPRDNKGEETNNGNNKKNKNNDTSNGSDKKTPPPKPTPNQPTQEQINKNREDLKQSTLGNDKEKLADSIKKNEEMKDKGVSQSSEDKAAEEAARKKLAEDKEKYRATIYQATKGKLETNGVKKEELGSEAKTKLEKLEKGEITEPSQVDEAEKIIIKDTYEKATVKKLTDLEKKVNQVIKSKDQKEIVKLQQELASFINNSNYWSKKSAAEALAKKLESAVQSNNSNDKNGDVPWKIIVPVGLVAVGALAGIIIYTRQRKLKNS